ncbi:hypothetical protein ANASTE_02249 [Anaerofustis stercorihominis DSM 17244]|uniref:Uncharacterized protein n=1 Tax=Anaerofustis stercorihominis DSM 17244 TaxID=445971 RepID=B1C9F6_9FIRM|nr:hypothetical protein ANASTE_02249 [Anaerofustis stercorihominis DSM 17244]
MLFRFPLNFIVKNLFNILIVLFLEDFLRGKNKNTFFSCKVNKEAVHI